MSPFLEWTPFKFPNVKRKQFQWCHQFLHRVKDWHLFISCERFPFQAVGGRETTIRWKPNFCTLPTPLLSFPPKNWAKGKRDLAKEPWSRGLLWKQSERKSERQTICEASMFEMAWTQATGWFVPVFAISEKVFGASDLSSTVLSCACRWQPLFKFEMFFLLCVGLAKF